MTDATLLPIKRKGTQRYMQPTLDRELPNSQRDERAFLYAVLVNNDVFFRSDLTTDDFFHSSYRHVYAAMCLMVEERVVDIGLVSLCTTMSKMGTLDAVGGPAFVSSIIDGPLPDIANSEFYANEIVRLRKKRDGILAGSRMIEANYDLTTEPNEVAAAAMLALSPVATREDQQARPIAEVMAEAFHRQQTLAEANRSIALDCGWPTLLSHKIFFPTLIVCSADRGLGKSSLMIQWSRNLAANGHANAMFSLESAPHDISLRYASMVTGIPHGYVRDFRTLSEKNKASMSECLREATNMGIHIAKGPRTIDGIILEIRRLKAMHGIQAVFIDYFQLLGSAKRYERHELMMGDIAQTLLAAAIDNDVAICAMSQVNREGGVAYADSIEKSARVRMHFDRPDKGCRVEFKITKNNEERTNDFDAHFDEVTQRWGEGTCEENRCRSLRGSERQGFLL